MTWPNGFAIAQVRVSRPTDQLAAVVRFYAEDLGLPELGRFTDHDGWDGVILGLPGADYHLEFTSYVGGSPGPAPTRENLLVLYFDTDTSLAAAAGRMTAAGHSPVELDNPYWAAHAAVAFEDPDGWRVVFMPN